jgi:hypothetical protein
MTWIIWIVVAVGVLAAAVLGLGAYGSARWAETTKALRDQLQSTRLPPTVTRYDSRELEGLPAPVQRYFRTVLKDGQRIITAATVEHIGTFNLSLTGDQWKPFTSQQWVVTRRPGFIWSARIAVMPGVAVYVHDAYLGGAGILNPAVAGLFSLSDQKGSDALDQGELIRFFSEAAWYPTALLPSQGVHWEPVDDGSAKATLVDGKISLTMLFRFNGAGLIGSVRVEARGATVGKSIVMTPWEGRWSNYQAREGMLIPLTAEAAWLAPEGRKTYWRGTITSLAYEFAE